MDDDRQHPEVVQTCDAKSLEWLFQPRNYGELLCRLIGPDEFEAKLAEAAGYDGPDGMPHRFRSGPLLHAQIILMHERVYLEEKQRRESVATNGRA